MGVYNLYIYNRRGICIYYHEWNRILNTLSDDVGEERRLMFGMLYSIQELAEKLSTSPSSGEKSLTLRTDAYALHCLKTASGIRFVLNTGPNAVDQQDALRRLYSDVYVKCVLRSPGYNPCAGQQIALNNFDTEVEAFVRSLPCFVT
eukprot:112959_1